VIVKKGIERMAGRNRKKKQMDAFIFPVPFAGVVMLFSMLALGYVWLGCRCEALGKELKALEKESSGLRKKFLNEKYKWARMKSPRNIEGMLAHHNISMTWPRRGQVVRLQDVDVLPAETAGTTGGGLEYAQLGRAVMNE